MSLADVSMRKRDTFEEHGLLMKGFPPPAERQVTLANWRKPPFNKWAFQHVREIVPSADIPNDPDNVRELPSALRDLKDLSIDDDGDALGLASFLRATDTDSLLVMGEARLSTSFTATGWSGRPRTS